MMCAVGNKKGIISVPSLDKKPPPSWQLPVLVVEEGPGKKHGDDHKTSSWLRCRIPHLVHRLVAGQVIAAYSPA